MTARGAIFFDLDGTLFDTRADLAATRGHDERVIGVTAAVAAEAAKRPVPPPPPPPPTQQIIK